LELEKKKKTNQGRSGIQSLTSPLPIAVIFPFLGRGENRANLLVFARFLSPKEEVTGYGQSKIN